MGTHMGTITVATPITTARIRTATATLDTITHTIHTTTLTTTRTATIGIAAKLDK